MFLRIFHTGPTLPQALLIAVCFYFVSGLLLDIDFLRFVTVFRIYVTGLFTITSKMLSLFNFGRVIEVSRKRL